MKSEPSAFSIDDLERNQIEPWDGVRNYQARNFLRKMEHGDQFLFYHSNAKPPGIVGIGEIVGDEEVDFTQFERGNMHYDPKATKDSPRWWLRRVKFIKKFPRMLSLEEIKNDEILKAMECAKVGSRLSVHPISEVQFCRVKELLKA